MREFPTEVRRKRTVIQSDREAQLDDCKDYNDEKLLKMYYTSTEI